MKTLKTVLVALALLAAGSALLRADQPLLGLPHARSLAHTAGVYRPPLEATLTLMADFSYDDDFSARPGYYQSGLMALTTMQGVCGEAVLAFLFYFDYLCAEASLPPPPRWIVTYHDPHGPSHATALLQTPAALLEFDLTLGKSALHAGTTFQIHTLWDYYNTRVNLVSTLEHAAGFSAPLATLAHYSGDLYSRTLRDRHQSQPPALPPYWLSPLPHWRPSL